MDGSEALEGGDVDEDEREDTEEHEDRDVVAELMEIMLKSTMLGTTWMA